jgi:hypothetical protein
LREVGQLGDDVSLPAQRIVLVDVCDRDAQFDQRGRDQLAAMAHLRLALAAHQDHPPLLAERRSDPLQPRAVERFLLHLRIHDLVVLVAVTILGLAAQLIAEENVADGVLAQMRFERVFRELRLEARVRCGAHIEHEFNMIALKDAHEIVQRAAAVADGEDRDRFTDRVG